MARARRQTPKRFTVWVRPKAAEDLDAIWLYIAHDAPANAERFLGKLTDAIDGLQHFPERYAVARESEAFAFTIRQRVVGRYRILFMVEGSRVRVLRVRSSFQAFLSPTDDPLVE